MSSITLGYRVEHPKYGTGYVRSIRRSSESRPYVCVFRQSDGTWRKHHLSAAEIRQKQLEAMRQALAKRREARQTGARSYETSRATDRVRSGDTTPTLATSDSTRRRLCLHEGS